jgi:hypothetical protein
LVAELDEMEYMDGNGRIVPTTAAAMFVAVAGCTAVDALATVTR